MATDGAWTVVPARPAPVLRGVVRRCAGFRHDALAGTLQTYYPGMTVPLVLDLGAGWRIATRASGGRIEHRSSFAAGLGEGLAQVQDAGPALCVQVDLSPTGARRVLGVPLHELEDRAVPLEDLMGADAARLVERLAAAPGWAERFALVEAALSRRLAAAPPVSSEVEWAFARLRRSGGQVRIGWLAAELGWSRKRLVARFRDEVGLAPKTAARVLRFEALLARLREDAARPAWAELARELGYADQSHLVREVRRLAGVPPTVLHARLHTATSVQDPAATAA